MLRVLSFEKVSAKLLVEYVGSYIILIMKKNEPQPIIPANKLVNTLIQIQKSMYMNNNLIFLGSSICMILPLNTSNRYKI